MATTFGALSEPFWKETEAVAVVPSEAPHLLADATEHLLSDDRHAAARDPRPPRCTSRASSQGSRSRRSSTEV